MDSVFGDPAPEKPKELVFEYRVDGRLEVHTFFENAVIDLPIPPTDAERVAQNIALTRGKWLRGNDWAITGPEQNVLQKLMHPPAEEYTVSMHVWRLVGAEQFSICLPLPMNNKQVLAVIDTAGNTPLSGLSDVDNKSMHRNATTRQTGRLLPLNREVVITYAVRNEGVVCTCDGVPIIEWNAGLEKLSLGSSLKVTDNKALYFFTTERTRFAIRDLKVEKIEDSASDPAASEETASLSPPPLKIKLEIIKAEFGLNNRQADVTKTLRRYVADLPVILFPDSDYGNTFGTDPIPNTEKELKIQYKINGIPGKATFAENWPVILPIPPEGPISVKIKDAKYGNGGRVKDVTGTRAREGRRRHDRHFVANGILCQHVRRPGAGHPKIIVGQVFDQRRRVRRKFSSK